MKKIINPFTHFPSDDYNCFGCSPHNEIGLHLEFYDAGDELRAYWNPDIRYVSYPGVLHGGIQATLLDEIGGWVVYLKCETVGVAQSMNLKYISPLRIGKSRVTLKARLMVQQEKNAFIHAELYDGEGKLCTEAELVYFIYPHNMAVKRFHYPGIEAFYEPGQSQYKCRSCNWNGEEKELDFDSTETCSGPDNIEVCPECGSMDVHQKRS